jgi:hypothetical protein
MHRRPLHFISREQEWELIQRLLTLVDVRDCTVENTAVVMVSPDYSATVAMHLAHAWSQNGDILDIIPLNVPYPDETAGPYIQELLMKIHEFQRYERLILVEAGIIRGTNWDWILKHLINTMNFHPDNITTVALCENIHSTVKSDYVAEYYDDHRKELMFYFERYNRHWPIR